MDPFIAQFYRLICQLLQSVGGRESHTASSHNSSLSKWLHVDLNADQILTYFPSHLRKSLASHTHSCGPRPNRDGLETFKLSEFLGLFKSYVRQCEAETRERRHLAGKAKLLQSLTARNAELEDQVLEFSRVSGWE